MTVTNEGSGFASLVMKVTPSTFSADQTDFAILARPFFNDDPNPVFNGQSALIVAHPLVGTGFVNAAARNEVLGSDVFARTMIDAGCNYRLDLTAGYQFSRIDDDLTIRSFTDQGAQTFSFLDNFDLENEFHGGSIGLLGEFYLRRWTVNVLGKIGVGNMRQRATISGQNTVTAGASVTTPGGLLTQPTNIGSFRRDLLVWAPEAGVKLNYSVNDCLSLSVGYSFLYWTRVALAGDAIDQVGGVPRVNGTQLNGGTLVGPPTPQFGWRDTDFWIQTIDIGVSYNF